MRKHPPLLLLLALLVGVPGTAAPAGAQQEAAVEALPPELVDGVLAFLNDPATTRLNGLARVAPGRTVEGPLGVVGGDLVVAGRIEGDLVLLNGDLVIEPGGAVTGDILIVGGRVIAAPDGAVAGRIEVHPQRLRIVLQGDRVELTPASAASRRGLYIGGARITVRAGTNYNRVEGLPVLFGPVFQTSGPTPLRVEALGIWRTEHDQTRDDLGYRFAVEQTFGPPTARLGLGVGAFSQVAPIEDWGIGDLESSMTSFLLHVDYRDYYEERGWNAFARAQIPGTTAEVTLEYRNRDMGFLPTGSPWTLRRNDRPWRAQPLVPEGELETLTAGLVWDERNDPDDPSDGWYLAGRVTRGLRAEWTLPALPDDPSGPLGVPMEVDAGFTTGFLDFRRHARLSPDQDLALRFIAAGSLDGDLPPAPFQRALGGEGSLPGFPLFELDCGARDALYSTVHRATDEPEPVYGRYGCGRIALFQIQYRGYLDLGLGPDPQRPFDGWLGGVDLNPSWHLFFDAGRGWSQEGDFPDERAVADLGAGVTLGGLGAYWAVPLSGEDRGLNFFLRLQRRF